MFSLDKTLLKKWPHKMQAKKGEEGGRGKPF
jgi:hypothetical protein